MALVPTIIEEGFASMIATKPATAADAATQLSDFYNTYALTGQAALSPPTLTSTEKLRFAAALLAVYSAPDSGTPALAAAGFVAAVTSFWMTPPVVFGPGLVTAFPGAPALQAALVALFSATNDADVAALGLATALDVATKTITVVVGPTTYTII
jgi:hypothetical protein